MSILVTTLIKDALLELGVVRPAETPTADQSVVSLRILNRILDDWNADERAVYNVSFQEYTFIPDQQLHTIGPAASSPDFTYTIRPERIVGANVLLNTTTPTVKVPINIRDDSWWLSLPVPSIETAFPTDLYYSPEWPLGKIYFWPIPSTAYGVQLELYAILSSVLIGDTINLPPGYQSALTLSLAEELVNIQGCNPAIVGSILGRAGKARARIFDVNDDPPKIQTQDSGMPQVSVNRATFNYRTGLDNSVGNGR